MIIDHDVLGSILGLIVEIFFWKNISTATMVWVVEYNLVL